MTEIAPLARVDLILPIKWHGQLVHAVTIETLDEEQLASIQCALRARSSRKALRRAVAIAFELPEALARLFCDQDLERTADAAAGVIRKKSLGLTNV